MIPFKALTSRPLIDIAYIKKILGCSNKYASLALSRWHNRGLLKKVSKDKYTTLSNIPLLATQLFTPSYLSFWSASQYLGYTEQILNTLQIAVTSRRKELEIDHYRIKFIVLPQRYFFGYDKIQTTEGPLFVAEPEKLLIDALLHPREMGNFDEIVKLVQKAHFAKEKLLTYLKATKNSSLQKRAGFLLEEYQKLDLSLPLKIKDKNYIPLDQLNRKNKKNKKINSKWRLTL